jgi:cyanate permease
MGISLASAALPLPAGLLLEMYSWRTTLGLLAAILVVILWATVLLGLPRVRGVAAQNAGQKMGGEIYRQRSFWLIGFCVALAFNAMIVLAVCYPPWLQGMGYTAAETGGLMALAGGAGLVGKGIVAVLGDAARERVRLLVVLLLLAQAAGLVVLLSGAGHVSVLLGLALAGGGGGGMLPMHPFLNSRYYAADIIGQVNGAQMPLFLPLGLVGAPLAGLVFDRTGSYNGAVVGLVVVVLLAVVLALLLPRPVTSPVPTGQTVA